MDAKIDSRHYRTWPGVARFSLAATILGVIERGANLSLARRLSRFADVFNQEASKREADRSAPTATTAAVNPNRKIFEARKRETAALGAGEKLVLGHPLAATIGDSARCMQNLEKVLFTGPKTSDTVTFICD